MLGITKTLVCIVILSIFGCAYLGAFSLPSGARSALREKRGMAQGLLIAEASACCTLFLAR